MSTREPTNRNRKSPTPIAGIIDGIVASLGLTRQYHGWMMVSKWPEIVGEHYARRSRAFRFADGILYVAVDDAVWRQQMAMDAEKILKIIHNYPHGRVVKNLRLVRGEKRTPTDGD